MSLLPEPWSASMGSSIHRGTGALSFARFLYKQLLSLAVHQGWIQRRGVVYMARQGKVPCKT